MDVFNAALKGRLPCYLPYQVLAAPWSMYNTFEKSHDVLRLCTKASLILIFSSYSLPSGVNLLPIVLIN